MIKQTQCHKKKDKPNNQWFLFHNQWFPFQVWARREGGQPVVTCYTEGLTHKTGGTSSTLNTLHTGLGGHLLHLRLYSQDWGDIFYTCLLYTSDAADE